MRTSVGRSVVIYACAFAVAGATPFVLLPILTKHLSPEQFGIATAFLMLVAILGNIAGLSANGFVSVRYFKLPETALSSIVSSSIGAIGVSHLLVAVAVAALFPWLSGVFGVPLSLSLLAVVTAFMVNLNLMFLALFQSSGQPLLYLRARMVQGILELLLCVALLFAVTQDAGARAYSYTAAIAGSAALGLAYGIRHMRLKPTVAREDLQALARFGLPMLPHIVAGSAVVYLDRLVVSSLLGAESLGIYMVGLQLGMALVALIEPLNKALAPWLFGQLAKDDSAVRRMIVQRTYQLYVALALAGLSVAGVALIFFDELIGPRFAAAKPLIPWMVAGFVLQGMYYSVVNYMFYAERTGRLSAVSATTAAVGCVVAYTLTSNFGLVGAAISFTINNGVLFLLVWRVAASAVPMPWLLRRA